MTEPDRWALPPLTLNDRCDCTCNAPAAARIILISGDLYVCAHHFTKFEVAIRTHAVHIQDERVATAGLAEMEPVGRMHMRRGLTHADPCRWCTTRLTNRRIFRKGTWLEYFICPICDETADPHIDTLKDQMT